MTDKEFGEAINYPFDMYNRPNPVQEEGRFNRMNRTIMTVSQNGGICCYDTLTASIYYFELESDGNWSMMVTQTITNVNNALGKWAISL